YYGTSWAAQAPADELIRGLSKDRWLYYLNERFEEDRIILFKLQDDKPLSNWMTLIGGLQIDPNTITGKNTRALIAATNTGDRRRIQTISQSIFKTSVN